jgi:hypothetical protein
VNVEDFPLLWINDNYYDTFKGNTFIPAGTDCIEGGKKADYDAVTNIDLQSQSLTTDFTFLNKFNNLQVLLLANNNNVDTINVTQNFKLGLLFFSNTLVDSIDSSNNPLLTSLGCGGAELNSIDLSNNPLLVELRLWGNNLSSIDLSNNPLIETLELFANTNITNIDISNNPLITYIRTQSTKCNEIVNSQILIDLDGHGQINGYFQSSIFGGGSLTAAGLTAKNNLQAKGWTIVGV